MPCEPIVTKGKITGWACSRLRGKPPPPTCFKCGKPASKLCDFRNYGISKTTGPHGKKYSYEWASINTCDKPMCAECAHDIGNDIHYCEEHNNEFSRFKANNAERVHLEQLKKLGLDDYH